MSLGSAWCRSVAMSAHSSISAWICWRVRVVLLVAWRRSASALRRWVVVSVIHLPIS